MIRCRRNQVLSTLLLSAALVFSGTAGAHNPDPLGHAPSAPAPGAAVEVVTGEVKELLVEDLVANVSIVYRTLALPDGTQIRLRGEGLDTLAKGSHVEVTGQRNGSTMFAHGAREVSPPRQGKSRIASSARASGKLQLFIVDYEDAERTASGFDLLRDDGTAVPLTLSVLPETLQRGMRVSVNGEALPDGSIEPEVVTIEALPAAEPEVQALGVTTDKVLVILMRFTDSPANPFTQAQVQAVMGGGPGSGSVAEFYKEASYGQRLMTVTVTPWLNTGASTPAGCNFGAMGTLGRNAANANGYNTTAYQKIVYVFPRAPSCGWLGLAYVGASGAWINGANTLLVYGHELGHNYGLNHSGSLDCGSSVIGGACTSSEYGDVLNIMGSSRAMHFAAAQKAALGWIAPGAVRTHTSGSAVYTLTPIEVAGGATYAVKVKPATNRTYWLEYRKPTGFDAGLSAFPNNGVQIRLESPFQTLCSGCGAHSQDTQLLDMTPGTASFNDATLLVGQSYTDTSYGITFNVLSSSANSLQVQVVSPGGAVSTTTLASALNPSTVGVSVALTASVTGTAPTGTVAFAANGSTIAGCSAVPLVGTGNTRTAVCATAALAAGTHSIVATYSGGGGNPSSASPALSQTVNAAAGAALNVALSTNGGTASASTSSTGRTPAKVIDGERKGASWNIGGGGWQDSTMNVWPDWVEIAFSGNKTIDRVVVYSLQDNYTNPVEPTDTTVGSQYVAKDFLVQGWNGSSWVTLATVTNNTLIKRTVTFNDYTTSRIRIHVTKAAGSYTRLTEVEAWTAGAAPLATTTALALSSGGNPSPAGSSVSFTASVTGSSPAGTVQFTASGTAIAGCTAVALTGSGNTRAATCTTSALAVGTHSIVAQYSGNATNAGSTSTTLSHTVSVTASQNVALAANGAVASASSTYSSGRAPSKLIDGERKGANWSGGYGGWQDATVGVLPDWVQVNFAGNRAINRVVVYSLQNNYTNPVEPSDTMTGSLYLVKDFLVQGWNGSSWVTLASVTNNTLIKRSVTFSTYTTSRIRIHVTKNAGSYTRLTEVEAWGQ